MSPPLPVAATRRERAVWSSATASALLNVFGMSIDLAIGQTIPGMPLWPNLACTSIGLGILVILLWQHRRPTVPLGVALFVINSLAVVEALWVTNPFFAETGRWSPFQAQKLGALAVALIAPGLSVGFAIIGAYVGAAVLQFLLFAPPRIKNALFFDE